MSESTQHRYEGHKVNVGRNEEAREVVTYIERPEGAPPHPDAQYSFPSKRRKGYQVDVVVVLIAVGLLLVFCLVWYVSHTLTAAGAF